MDTQIRAAREEDFEAVSALVEQVHKLHATNRPDVYREGTPLCKERFAALCAGQTSAVLVAEQDACVVGYCEATLRAPSEQSGIQPRKVLYLETLCVEAQCRRQGIGVQLYRAIERQAQESGCDALELMVWQFNATAMEFYKSLGLTVRSTVLEQRL